MPIQRRLPKRGFKNPFRVGVPGRELGQLVRRRAGTIDRAWLEAGSSGRGPGQAAGGGDLTAALTVKVDAAAKSARRRP